VQGARDPVDVGHRPVHDAGIMRVDFYYDIVCPYAYLASTRIEALAARCGAELRWRPMLLGGVFRAIGGNQDPNRTMSPARARMNLLDMHRWADHWGVPLSMPSAHPRRSVEAMRLLVGAPESVRPALSHALYRAYWVEGRDIADLDVLSTIAAEHGVDPKVIGGQAAREGLFAATDEAVSHGIFGVPAFVVDGRLIWGQDRLHLVEAALGGAPSAYVPQTQGGVIRFFHDFASPFSYLAAARIDKVAQAHGARVEWCPILLGALFRSIGTADVPLFEMNAPKRRYLARDLDDWAAHTGTPFHFPSHFPMRSVLPLRVALAEPRLTLPLYTAAWADDRAIDDVEVLSAVVRESGFDPGPLIAAAGSPEIKGRLRENTAAAEKAGACGVPTFEVRSTPTAEPLVFWGQDRIEMVQRALDGWRPNCG